MKPYISIVFCAVSLALSVQSFAETHVINPYNFAPALSPDINVYPVETGAALDGVSSVSVRVVGIGGGGFFDCPGEASDGWRDLEIVIQFGGRNFRMRPMDQLAFDETVTKTDWEENPMSPIEGAVIVSLGSRAGASLAEAFLNCTVTSADLPVLSYVEITIEASSVVGTAECSWGTLKSHYY